MKKSLIGTITGVVLLSLLVAGVAFAKSYNHKNKLRVTITNVTRGQIFSPPIVISHNSRFTLFEPGEPASPELVLLAEDGNPSGLVGVVSSSSNVLDYVVADGPVLPGSSVTLTVNVDRHFRRLSLAGMLVTTNDAFVAVRSAGIPWGWRQLEAAAYDAGSEANSEACDFIPGPPCGNGGVRDTADAEGFVHIHSGIHGTGDLLPSRDDWRNPVAKITMQLIE